jgi:hypothetical protein
LNESSTKRDVSRATASQISDDTNKTSNSSNLKKTPTKKENGNEINSLLYGSPSSNLRSRLIPSTAVIEKRKHKQKTTDKKTVSKKLKVITKDKSSNNSSSGTDTDDDSDDESRGETSSSKMKVLEESARKARKDLNADANNEALLEVANQLERSFNRSLFKTKLRTGNTVTWYGWKQGCCELVELTKYGVKYSKTHSK